MPCMPCFGIIELSADGPDGPDGLLDSESDPLCVLQHLITSPRFMALVITLRADAS